TLVAAHELFLKHSAFFVAPGATVHLTAMNGTFTTSEASVTADRLLDLAVIGPAGRTRGETSAWTAPGKASKWDVKLGAAGTYVLGASLRPRLISMKGPAFNAYLKDDGLPDILAARKAKGELARSSTERYAKHVKALVQVGDARTPGYSTVLGYPAELVPMENPYDVARGARVLHVKALVDGKPMPDQVVLAGGRTSSGARIAAQSVRTDAQGIATISLATPGEWYVKFICMARVPPAPKDSVDYESKWATLTFAVK
ncbi:MAG: NikM domain containing protein, partial [Acidobacteria bacterium]|nr:NikM domain containing protein [Acidobacteriota bacterium]